LEKLKLAEVKLRTAERKAKELTAELETANKGMDQERLRAADMEQDLSEERCQRKLVTERLIQ